MTICFARMSTPRLSEASYIVLGMLERVQPATPYDLKQVAQLSTTHFWTIPHSQLYAECERLAKEGLLSEEREEAGRRRRIYRVTQAGLEALEKWRAGPGEARSEVRDLGILKLFLGADPAMLAKAYLPKYEANLLRYEELRNASGGIEVPRGPWLALDAGIGHMRENVRFWKRLLEEEDLEDDDGEKEEASAG
jgi:PadR family transcriptional regulator, regulatory protein AphA